MFTTMDLSTALTGILCPRMVHYIVTASLWFVSDKAVYYSSLYSKLYLFCFYESSVLLFWFCLLFYLLTLRMKGRKHEAKMLGSILQSCVYKSERCSSKEIIFDLYSANENFIWLWTPIFPSVLLIVIINLSYWKVVFLLEPWTF